MNEMAVLRWRPMVASDLSAVKALADRVHPRLPESEAMFRNRLDLFPAGCFVLERDTGEVAGYAISHPIEGVVPPPLDCQLASLPEHPDGLLIHDVALEPAARGSGAAGRLVEQLLELASAYGRAILVSVYGTAPFWARFGFRASDAQQSGLTEAYGADAVLMINSSLAISPRQPDGSDARGTNPPSLHSTVAAKDPTRPEGPGAPNHWRR